MAFSGSRSAYGLTRHALRHCQSATRTPSSGQQCIARGFATAAEKNFEPLSQRVEDSESPDGVRRRPRWSYTPEGMKAPFSPHITKNPKRSIWKVNEDPDKLDKMYINLLGKNGDKMLPEEIKWLAVTHKSFDQGRRGFNDRLAYMGRQSLALEAMREVVSSDQEGAMIPDEHGREPFSNPALQKIDNLNIALPHTLVTKEKLEQLAFSVGLDKVVRWKPAKPENLAGSGQQIVLTSTIFAIAGAITLQHGAQVAGTIIKERILKPMSSRS
ncbi:hypothetical protein C8034_v000255 [Colletotrichum sidae]|uniref:RNase III domain-containing protein n=2 Tax=Colletotrichum orbiculare species complex TaxID=2707354 RepID=A0A4R8QLX4_9PEZI|nr:hypothetical protein C8035_v006850 [Colletotrichum spinosum]TEA17183.1 hypothetical protein C8034_v000255 [Colletotrichum sidae]